MKYFFYDCETTGTRYWKNGVWQISGLIEIDGEIKEEFDFLVCPFKDALIEDEALEVGGVTKEQVLSFPPMSEVYVKLVTMLGKYVDKFNKKDKYLTVGYNSASFDDAFFRAWFVQNSDAYFGSWFSFPNIDVAVLAGEHLKETRLKMENFQLKTVAKELGIKVDESRLHDATYDIYLTREIYRIVTKSPGASTVETNGGPCQHDGFIISGNGKPDYCSNCGQEL